MTAARRAGDHLTVCPSCGRDVRVTEDELIVGRSFCACCGHRFAVEQETLGDTPLRSFAMVRADGGRPPDAKIVLRHDGAIDVFARSAGKRAALGVAGLVGIVASVAYLAPTGLTLVTMFTGFCALSLVTSAWAAMASRQRISQDGETLMVATGPFALQRRRIAVGDIEGVTVEDTPQGLVVRVAIRGGRKVDIGAGYRISAHAATWLLARLTDMAHARSTTR